MAQVIVRNLDDKVVDALKCRAELHGHSLEQELRDVLTKAARLTPQEKLALSRRIRAMTPKGVRQTDSAVLIREDRDNRR
ncbi:MAG: plasmid stabilization protein [Rhodospirillales bacterium]